MGRVLLFATALVSFAAHAVDLQAQAEKSGGWDKSVHFTFGASLARTDWSISHPLYMGAVRHMETINGIGSRPSSGTAGVEFRKHRVALQANLGWMSSRLTLTDVPENITGNDYPIGHTWDFSTYQVEGAVLFSFLDREEGATPFVSAGIGYALARGDTDMSGGSLSLGAGIRFPLSGRLEARAGVTGRYFHFSSFDLLPPVMTPDLVLKPVSVTIGLSLDL